MFTSPRPIFLSLLITLSLSMSANAFAENGASEQPTPGFEQAPQDKVEPGFSSKSTTPALDATGWSGFVTKQSSVQVDDAGARKEIASAHGVKLDAQKHMAFRGNFTAGHQEGDELMVLDLEDGTLSLYRKSRRITRLRGLEFPSKQELEKLGITQIASPITIVPDGTTQILVWRKLSPQSTSKKKRSTTPAPLARKHTAYHATVYKVVGSYIGAPLDREVARASKKNDFTLTATLEPTRKGQFTRFIYTPIDSEGAANKSERLELRWNQWEGVFRHPRPVPTAPRRDTPNS